MKIRRHYLAIRRAFASINEHTPFEVTTQELADLLECTHRNMVILLKRMQQEEWLAWEPKRGRGNRSSLSFLVSKEQIALLEAQEMVQKQDLRSALELLGGIDESTKLKDQFQEWLSGQFGFHSEVQGKRRTDILRFPLPQTIYSLDPAAIHFTGESHLVNQLFDGLVRIDPKGEQILPQLAHAWEVDETRKRWNFYLRKGVLFHHGRELDSSDVKFSLERLRLLAPQGLYSWAYTDILSMDTPDDTTIRIELAEPNEAFLAFLTTNRASIIPQDVCEAAGDRFAVQPVGTGPFRLIGQEQGVWILEAFASYFQGRAFLDRVEVWTVTEGSEREGSTELQPFQIMHNARLTDMAADRWQQVRQSGMTCKFITVNEQKDGLLANPAIRAAIDHAIERRELLQLLSGDVIEAVDSFWPEEEEKVRPNKASSQNFSDIKNELAASGYRGETLVLATIPQYEADAEMIQQVCALSGIPLEINLIPAEAFKGTDRMSADLLLFAIMLDEHRELRLIDLYKSMQQHALPEIHHMLERSIRLILSEPEPKLRAAIFKEIENQLKERHSLLFLYRKHLKTAFHPSVRGISLESLGWVRFKDIWFT
ncbi:MarR-like DNA-binding transcriptional regulator SgrR of sgrS sRNA [Paenibacillus castaneae]|uniref:ABC transporter substrate-binding protein n=1 Tax=Paenibacillus castaneae TaxID=474957 RepID=UPI000C9CDDAB|nr:ABC transporter substrate-binding protein [Paenibacillus castaneae]NIK78956.1 MarR-like DNA-binding transcriptional regulator SgrR of sgrS sRNA [Paenibacillus castaneae]